MSSGSSGDVLSIPDNRNDASNDTINPYAYPYFHSDGTSPLLYDLIVQFGGQWMALDLDEHDDNNDDNNNNNNNSSNTTTTSHRNVVAADTTTTTRWRNTMNNHHNHHHHHRLAQLVRQIEVRSERVPKEASWKDSCGDTSLHRLCQVARLPAWWWLWPQSKWLVLVARALIRADPNLTTAVNNWQETPLLQFVTHCGFPLQQPQQQQEEEEPLQRQAQQPEQQLADVESNNNNKNNNSNHRNDDDDDDDEKYVLMDMNANPMLELLELLLWGGAASIESYPHMNLPIHCACNTGLVRRPRRFLPNHPTSRTTSSILQRPDEGDDDGHHPHLVTTSTPSLIMRPAANRRQQQQQQQQRIDEWLEKQHFTMVKRIIRSFPAGIEFCDSKRRPPLLNAIVSNACLDITELLLHNGGWQQHCTSILLEELFAQFTTNNSMTERIHECILNGHVDITDCCCCCCCCLDLPWKKTKAVLRTIAEDHRLVHAAIKTSAPVIVLQLAIRMYPEELNEQNHDHTIHHHKNDDDSTMTTPLMLALTKRNLPPMLRLQYVQLLLQANPQLAKIPNAAGQLPLHVACSQADGVLLQDWGSSSSSSVRDNNNNNNGSSSGGGGGGTGLSTLFQCHPTAVSRRDPVTRLFPFQMAAAAAVASATTGADSTTTTTTTTTTTFSLDCTFELLKADPSVLLLFS